jgi:dephospho-CoA kinase
MSRVFVLTGMPGAGKEEFVKVAQQEGFAVIKMGDVVRQEAVRRGITMDDQGVGGFATSERQVHGPGIWAMRCLPMLGHGDVLIDGSRSVQEMEVFRSNLGRSVKLVAVHTSPAVRYERLKRRSRYDAPRSPEEFNIRDERELGWGLGTLIALADVMLVNEGTLEKFYETVRETLVRPW